MNTMGVIRCHQCGWPMPPTSAPAHQCPAPFNMMGLQQNWHESAIRQIVREEIQADAAKGKTP